jgi:hypothetical protein
MHLCGASVQREGGTASRTEAGWLYESFDGESAGESSPTARLQWRLFRFGIREGVDSESMPGPILDGRGRTYANFGRALHAFSGSPHLL